MFEKQALETASFPPLEMFPNPLTSNGRVIRITFPEFTCLCPKTGYPDFAAITLYYIPNELCVELKSWKLYLNSFRNVGAFHEAVVQHILSHFVLKFEPIWVSVVGDFIPRGNVDTLVILEHGNQTHNLGAILREFKPRCRGFGE